MLNESRRIKREKKTVEAMIKIYCEKNHQSKHTLCAECQTLFDYALIRLTKCPFQENKPTCAKCPVHCYKEAEKTKIKEVMRFSGPKMLFSHPILAIYHLIDGIENKPSKPKQL